MPERRYSDDEVREILRLAAEPERLPARQDPDGMSLVELESIGSEVGISPAAIRQAASALESRAVAVPQPTGGLLGAPSTAAYERTVRVRATADQHAEIVVAIRRAMGRHGVVTGSPDQLEWRARDAVGGRYVTVQRIGDHTLVRVYGNFRDGAGGFSLAIGSMGGVLAMMALKMAGVLSLVFAPAVAVAAVLPARLFWKRRFASEDRALRETLTGVVGALERPDSGETPER